MSGIPGNSVNENCDEDFNSCLAYWVNSKQTCIKLIYFLVVVWLQLLSLVVVKPSIDNSDEIYWKLLEL